MKSYKGSATQSNIIAAINNNIVNKIEDNILYVTMSNILQSWFKDGGNINVEVGNIHTVVDCKGGFTVVDHSCTDITLQDGSHVRICPTHNECVDVTRIMNCSGIKGIGTILMDIVIDAFAQAKLQVKQYPNSTLVLECLGSVGAGDNRREMPIKDQAAFFRKFGFRKFGKYDANHLHFKLEANEDFSNSIKRIAEKGL